MTTDELVADLDVLRSRIDLVEAVRSEPRQKPALATALDCSRSTVSRAVRELEGAGLLRRGTDGYELTLYGDLLYERYDRFLADAATIADVRSLLEALPPDAPMDPDVVTGATIARSTPPAPYDPLTRVRERIDGTERLRGVAYRVPDPSTLSLLVERIDDDLEGNLVVGSRLMAYLLEHNREAVETMRTADRFELAVGDSTPYTLLAFEEVSPATAHTDGHPGRDESAASADENETGVDEGAASADDAGTGDVVLVVYDEHGDLEGTITADDPGALAWARNLIQERRHGADPVSEWLGDGSAGRNG